MGASQCQGCASDAIVADRGREASGRPTTTLPVRRVGRIDRPAVDADLVGEASFFLGLDRSVMARLADGLKRAAIEVRFLGLRVDVVTDRGAGDVTTLQALLTKRMLGQLCCPDGLPTRGAVKLPIRFGFRAAAVLPGHLSYPTNII